MRTTPEISVRSNSPQNLRQFCSNARLAGLLCLLCWSFGPIRMASPTRPANKTMPDASELARLYNQQAGSIHSAEASIYVVSTARGTYKLPFGGWGEISASILMQRPYSVRMTGETELGDRSYFDALADGKLVQMYVRSLRTVYQGLPDPTGATDNPSLTPAKLLDALFWPELPAESLTKAEVTDDPDSRSTILAVSWTEGGKSFTREVWFRQNDLKIIRVQSLSESGTLQLQLSFSDWVPVASKEGSQAHIFPRRIVMTRPGGDSEINIRSLSLNEEIPPSQFHLQIPSGTRIAPFASSTPAQP